MKKIIYSKRIMENLVQKGHYPIYVMPNPKEPKYNCWVFDVNEEFQNDLDQIMEGRDRIER